MECYSFQLCGAIREERIAGNIETHSGWVHPQHSCPTPGEHDEGLKYRPHGEAGGTPCSGPVAQSTEHKPYLTVCSVHNLTGCCGQGATIPTVTTACTALPPPSLWLERYWRGGEGGRQSRAERPRTRRRWRFQPSPSNNCHWAGAASTPRTTVRGPFVFGDRRMRSHGPDKNSFKVGG